MIKKAPVRPKGKMFRFDEVQRLHVSAVGRECSSKTKEKDVRFDEVQRFHVLRDGKEGSSKTKEKDVQIR